MGAVPRGRRYRVRGGLGRWAIIEEERSRHSRRRRRLMSFRRCNCGKINCLADVGKCTERSLPPASSGLLQRRHKSLWLTAAGHDSGPRGVDALTTPAAARNLTHLNSISIGRKKEISNNKAKTFHALITGCHRKTDIGHWTLDTDQSYGHLVYEL